MIENLKEILENHLHWLKQDCDNWVELKADLRGADLRGTDLRGANLRSANLSCANLNCANLRNVNLSYADFSGAKLKNANLRGASLAYANLSEADLRNVDLSCANLNCAKLNYADLNCANLSEASLNRANLNCAKLNYADLNRADLSCANLNRADLSEAIGVISSIDFLKQNFEFVESGVIAYKTFNGSFVPNSNWKIEPNSIITENVNANRTDLCGCGINVAPLKWVKNTYAGDIWKVLIKWEWLCGVVIPYNTDGKIRCEKVQLIEIIDRS